MSGIVLYFLKRSLMSGLIEDIWILTSAPAVNLLWYCASRSLWETPLCSHERMRLKKANTVFVLLWKQFWSPRPLKASWNPQVFQDHTLKTTVLGFLKNNT